MAFQLFQPPLAAFSPSSFSTSLQTLSFSYPHHHHHHSPSLSASVSLHHLCQKRRRNTAGLVFVDKEDTELLVSSTRVDQEDDDPNPEDLEYVSEIKRVLELLKKNRDMLFSEVKLTVMIEDPREVESRWLLGIDDSDTPTRDDLVAA